MPDLDPARSTTAPRPGRKRKRNPHKPPSLPLVGPPMAYSVAAFCLAHAISPAMFYKLRGQGRGPDETRIGTRVVITAEAAARWRKQREDASRDAK